MILDGVLVGRLPMSYAILYPCNRAYRYVKQNTLIEQSFHYLDTNMHIRYSTILNWKVVILATVFYS